MKVCSCSLVSNLLELLPSAKQRKRLSKTNYLPNNKRWPNNKRLLSRKQDKNHLLYKKEKGMTDLLTRLATSQEAALIAQEILAEEQEQAKTDEANAVLADYYTSAKRVEEEAEFDAWDYSSDGFHKPNL